MSVWLDEARENAEVTAAKRVEHLCSCKDVSAMLTKEFAMLRHELQNIKQLMAEGFSKHSPPLQAHAAVFRAQTASNSFVETFSLASIIASFPRPNCPESVPDAEEEDLVTGRPEHHAETDAEIPDKVTQKPASCERSVTQKPCATTCREAEVVEGLKAESGAKLAPERLEESPHQPASFGFVPASSAERQQRRRHLAKVHRFRAYADAETPPPASSSDEEPKSSICSQELVSPQIWSRTSFQLTLFEMLSVRDLMQLRTAWQYVDAQALARHLAEGADLATASSVVLSYDMVRRVEWAAEAKRTHRADQWTLSAAIRGKFAEDPVLEKRFHCLSLGDHIPSTLVLESLSCSCGP